MDLKELALHSKGILFGDPVEVINFSIDTRTLNKGDVYIAIKGDRFDGHDFILEAEKNGAKAFIVSKQIQTDLPYILVKNTINFIEEIAILNRSSFKGNVIGITGTNGKTTSKQILSTLLSKIHECHKTQGNKNNHIGVPFCMLNLTNSFPSSVMEIGTSQIGEIKTLTKIIKPNIAAITNVSAGHLEGLKDTNSIAEEKGDILKFEHSVGVAILPRDSIYFDFWKKKTNARSIYSFGLHKDSDFRVVDPKVDLNHLVTNFVVKSRNEEEQCTMNGIGIHNTINAAMALSVCHVLGLKLSDVKSALERIEFPERRLSLHESFKGSLLIDDSYNSNPASMKRSIDVLNEIPNKTKICLFGEMKELGNDSKKMHTEVYQYARERTDYLLCIGDEWSGVEAFKGSNDVLFQSHQDLYDRAKSLINQKSVTLVKGSRSTRMDIIADKLKQ